jgi:hypothetical protein
MCSETGEPPSVSADFISRCGFSWESITVELPMCISACMTAPPVEAIVD